MASAEGVTISVLLNDDRVKIVRVEIAPGATVPQHSHDSGFYVLPYTSGSWIRTTYQGGKEVSRETIMLNPAAPYHVAARAAGVTTTIHNPGPGVIVCSKLSFVTA